MFRRINIDQENREARESNEVLSGLLSESTKLVRIAAISIGTSFLILFCDLLFLSKLDSFMQSMVTSFLVLSIIHCVTSSQRLRELKLINHSKNTH